MEGNKSNKKKRKNKIILITSLAVIVFGYLVYTGVRDTMLYYLTVSELKEKWPQASDGGVRVGGMVNEGSVKWDPKTLKLSFVMGDKTNTLPVIYSGVVPDSFKQGREVVIEGIYADGVLKASQIMPTCPSKYE